MLKRRAKAYSSSGSV